jgi:hypothetical protein
MTTQERRASWQLDTAGFYFAGSEVTALSTAPWYCLVPISQVAGLA